MLHLYYTCVELSSSPTTRARLAPMSKVGSASVGWVAGRRGAIVTLHARARGVLFWAAANMALFPYLLSLTAAIVVVVLRLCGSSQ
eukprot:scaffold12306_cov147-Isochrysis_galbana.AAC.1